MSMARQLALTGISRLGRPGQILAPELDRLMSIDPRRLRQAAKQEADRAASALEDGFYRRLWANAAVALGAEVEEIGGGFYRISRRGVDTIVWRQEVMLDDVVSLRFASHKSYVHTRLLNIGIRVPEYHRFSAVGTSGAVEFLKRKRSCVVKPEAGTSNGLGVTPGITTEEQLKRATVHASRFGRELLIENCEDGVAYRLLFLDGQLIGAVRRLSPRVQGDGNSSICDLIYQENERRLASPADGMLALLRMDLDCLLTLARAGLTLSSIPKRDQLVMVKQGTNQNCLSDNHTALEELGDSLVDGARAAVAAVGLRLAGVDVMTSDPQAPLTEVGVVLEVNGTPGLNQHRDSADPDAAHRVAVPILARLLAQTQGGVISLSASGCNSDINHGDNGGNAAAIGGAT